MKGSDQLNKGSRGIPARDPPKFAVVSRQINNILAGMFQRQHGENVVLHLAGHRKVLPNVFVSVLKAGLQIVEIFLEKGASRDSAAL
jgi:hypothetical protein